MIEKEVVVCCSYPRILSHSWRPSRRCSRARRGKATCGGLRSFEDDLGAWLPTAHHGAHRCVLYSLPLVGGVSVLGGEAVEYRKKSDASAWFNAAIVKENKIAR